MIQSPPRSVTLVAEIIDALNPPPSGPGHPPAPTVNVIETLRFFLREGVQWRALNATDERACGSTLRRRLKDWSATGVLRAVQARLITMIRCGPQPLAEAGDVIVDSCSVRAKRGGELIGPNPTDRGKPGSKYHVVVAPDGIPLGAVVSGANVNDTLLLPHLLRLALVVCAAIARLVADAGYDSAANRAFCLRNGVAPLIRNKNDAHGSGLGKVRHIVENTIAWLLSNKRLDRRNDRSTLVIQALLTAGCIFIIANRLGEL